MHSPEIPPQPRIHLTEARNNRGLSQQEVADLIGSTHVNVSRWERGITRPSPYFRRKLCGLFGKTEEELDLVAVHDEGETSQEATLALASGTSSAPTVVSGREGGPVHPGALYDPAIPLPPAYPLVGRELDLARIKQRLRGVGNVALTALNGLPGVGKTALSITLAHDPELRDHFSDGVLWAGLGPNPNMPGLLSRWGSLLGISQAQMATLSGNEAWARAIRTAIGTRKMLLVIDDAWQLEEALTVRVGGPNCAHLVTTRFPAIAAHMAVGGATMIQELNVEESLQLLDRLAPQVVSREAQRAQDLVQAVGGLPLALTLLGNYLRKQAYSGPARRITAAMQRLSDAQVRLQISEPHVPVESHPSLPIETSLSLQSVIAVTDQLLPEPAQLALYTLAVFPPKPNTFSEEAALAVTASTIDELDALSDAGLLESNGERYTLHQVIADYAHFRLPDLEASKAHSRLIAYITDYVETHKKDYELLQLESNTIRTALDLAYEEGKQPELVHVACDFAPFLILRGFYPDAEHHLKRAYGAAVQLDDKEGIIGTVLYLGEIEQRQGNYPQAEAHLQQGLTLARQINNNERICALLTQLGTVLQHQGHFQQAETAYQEGLRLARNNADNESICTLLSNLAWLNRKRGELAQSESYLQEGLILARKIDDPERLCGLLGLLGSVVGSRGDFAQAETYLQEGLVIARQLGDSEQICVHLISLGVAAARQGKNSQAKMYDQEGLKLARQIGHREHICLVLSNLGAVFVEENNYIQAEACFQEGLKVARQIGHREQISYLLLNLGMTTHKQGYYDVARLYLEESLDLANQISQPRTICVVLCELGDLSLSEGRTDQAAAAFRKMLEMAPAGDQESLALAYYGLAQVSVLYGEMKIAKEYAEKSAAAFEAMKHRKADEVKGWVKSTF
jgi:tetratricopeptide (TPR) repeat protein/transcriptional regulator with XRE-family HTH domain